MCCKHYWKKILSFAIALTLGVLAAGFIQQETASITEKENGGMCLKYRTANYPLEIISMPNPEYTAAARQHQIAGVVRLRVTFLASGEIGNVTPVESLPDGLTEKAVEAARKIKFKPSVEFGKEVAETKTIEYSFAIQ